MDSMTFKSFENMTNMNNGEITAVCNELASYMGNKDHIDIYIKNGTVIISALSDEHDSYMAHKGLHEVDWKYIDLSAKKPWKEPELKVNDIVNLSIK